jgi:hypothetical protein
MATIYQSARVDVPADVATDFLLAFADAEVHVFSMVKGERLEGDDRIITRFDGSELVEHNVTVDPARRRVVYTVPDMAEVTHHQAEMRVDLDAHGTVTLAWTIDFLPHRLAAERTGTYNQLFVELIAAMERFAADRAAA